jgi:hypothetical protein
MDNTAVDFATERLVSFRKPNEAATTMKTVFRSAKSPEQSVRSPYVGPATVLGVEGVRVRLETPDAYPSARMAMAIAYEAVPGDVVLVMEGTSDWYVVGVLQGRGATNLTVPGDLNLRAPNGAIVLMAGREVRVTAPVFGLVAETVETVAKAIIERCVDVSRRVAGCLHLHAGRVRAQTDESFEVHAKEIHQSAEKDVRIDGEKIHLA